MGDSGTARAHLARPDRSHTCARRGPAGRRTAWATGTGTATAHGAEGRCLQMRRDSD